MKKVEEFNKTQALIDEFKNFSTRDEEIENEKKQINLRIERLEEEMQPNEEDEELHSWWVEMADRVFRNWGGLCQYVVDFYLRMEHYHWTRNIMMTGVIK